jgi:RimJ/RimL family protein N-acetyltransferase
MTELTDVSGAFGYGDSILVGERVRLRGVPDDDLPTLAMWEMDPGRMATLSSWVVPPSEAAAKERIVKSSANEKDDLGFAIETLGDPPMLIGNIGLWGARPKDRCASAYQKAGFVEEGRHRESVLHDGRWYDEVLMSILDHEWAAGRSSGT